jgi:hypothetical protein
MAKWPNGQMAKWPNDQMAKIVLKTFGSLSWLEDAVSINCEKSAADSVNISSDNREMH